MARSLPPSFLSLLPDDHIGSRARARDGVKALRLFRHVHGRFPLHGDRFNDRMAWIRLSGVLAEPLRRAVTDKVKMKALVRAAVGETYVVPTLAVLRTSEEVERFDYPTAGAVKPSHASQRVYFLNPGEAPPREVFVEWLRWDYHTVCRETNYRGIEHGLLVEPLVFGERGPADFKFHCMNGRLGLVHVDADRYGDHRRRDYFDRAFRPLPIKSSAGAVSDQPMDRPASFAAMRELAESLAGYFDGYVRVDLYTDGEDIKVGELTPCDGNGLIRFDGPESDRSAWAHIVGKPS